MRSEKKAMTFEAAMARLEEILALLEDGGAPLDQTMALYEEGAKLAAYCAKKLGEAEQKVEKLDALPCGGDAEPSASAASEGKESEEDA